MIKDELKGVLYLDNGVICRRHDTPMITKSKFEEFKYILFTNEDIDNENNTWDKLWKGNGFVDLNYDERVECLCSQNIKSIFHIQNLTSGNIYQVGCDCVGKNISEILARNLRKDKYLEKKRKKEIEKDIESSTTDINRMKNEIKTYKNKVNDIIYDYHIFNGFGKYKGVKYTIQQIIDGVYSDYRHSWITIDKMREDAIKTNFKYILFPEIKDFLKSGYSTPQQYMVNIDSFPINIVAPRCKCGNMTLKQTDDRNFYYCMNWNNIRKCEISYIKSYLKHPYVPPNKHALRYFQQLIDTKTFKILELKRELEELNK